MRTLDKIVAELNAPPYNLKTNDIHLVELDQHERWEKQVRKILPNVDEPQTRYMAVVLVNRYLVTDIKQVIDFDVWTEIEAKYPPVVELLKTIWATEASLKDFRQLSIFYDTQASALRYQDDDSMMGLSATELSWTADYRDEAANALHEILEGYLQPDYKRYTRVAPIIQSSGTGKSRMVDELGRRVVSIPLNVTTGTGSGGYPPRDGMEWIHGNWDRYEESSLRHHFESFLFGLMEVTKKHLENIDRYCQTDWNSVDSESEYRKRVLDRLAMLAVIFRSHMTIVEAGTSYNRPWIYGRYRVNFYEEVRVTAKAFRHSAEPDVEEHLIQKDTEESVATAADRLRVFLDPKKLCDSDLLLVIDFDEAHPLTEFIESREYMTPWTRYSALCRALGCLRGQPFFTVVLATLPNFRACGEGNPNGHYSRTTPCVFSPIVVTPFDAFAERVSIDGKWTLDRLASTHQIAHLGRSLFATRYDYGYAEDRYGLVSFAAQKLIRRAPYKILPWEFENKMALACLAVRLDLNFKDGPTQFAEKRLIEGHMRICLHVTSDFANLVTTSSSELLMAEGALYVTEHNEWNRAHALLHNIYCYVDPGKQGELVARLLIVLARDAALALVKKSQRPTSKGRSVVLEYHKNDGADRVVSVASLLQALLGTNATSMLEKVPSSALPGEENIPLRDAFANASIWFNHVVKVNHDAMVGREHLCTLLARGAAMTYTADRAGVNLVVPIVFNNSLAPQNVSAIMIRLNDDRAFSADRYAPRAQAFGALNPFYAGLYDLEPGVEKNLQPVIRMVFAFGSKTSAVSHIPPLEDPPIGVDNFTSYDILCEGLSASTFAVIASNDEDTYQSLLSKTYPKSTDPHGLLEDKEVVMELYRGMRPGMDVLPGFSRNFVAEIP